MAQFLNYFSQSTDQPDTYFSSIFKWTSSAIFNSNAQPGYFDSFKQWTSSRTSQIDLYSFLNEFTGYTSSAAGHIGSLAGWTSSAVQQLDLPGHISSLAGWTSSAIPDSNAQPGYLNSFMQWTSSRASQIDLYSCLVKCAGYTSSAAGHVSSIAEWTSNRLPSLKETLIHFVNDSAHTSSTLNSIYNHTSTYCINFIKDIHPGLVDSDADLNENFWRVLSIFVLKTENNVAYLFDTLKLLSAEWYTNQTNQTILDPPNLLN